MEQYEEFPNIRPLMDSRDGQVADPPAQVFEQLNSEKTHHDSEDPHSSEPKGKQKENRVN